MNAETDLQTLVASMKPALHAQPYVFCSIDQAVFARLPFIPLGTFHEREGVTIIATREQASDSGLEFDMSWACITLEVHSSLATVGFMALITARLAHAGISVNPVSAFHHDHLFVPWEMKEHALAELTGLSRSRCENMRNAVRILKLVSEGEADVREGRVKSQEEVFQKIESSG